MTFALQVRCTCTSIKWCLLSFPVYEAEWKTCVLAWLSIDHLSLVMSFFAFWWLIRKHIKRHQHNCLARRAYGHPLANWLSWHTLMLVSSHKIVWGSISNLSNFLILECVYHSAELYNFCVCLSFKRQSLSYDKIHERLTTCQWSHRSYELRITIETRSYGPVG